MKSAQTFTAGSTVATLFDRAADAQTAAERLRAAGFADVRLSEQSGRTRAEHVAPADGQTETDFASLLERAGFEPSAAQQLTRAVAGGAVLLTVASPQRAADAAAVLRGETIAAQPLGPVDDTSRQVSGGWAGAAAPTSAPLASTPSDVQPGDRIVPLREERLDVGTERTTAEARIRKEVVTETKTISVPVEREQLVVERDGERDVRIPLSGETPL